VLRRKIKIVMVEKLKPFGYPKDPIGIIRCRYKYSKDNEDYYILADFEIKYEKNDNGDEIGVSYANWSKYNFIEDEINNDNPPHGKRCQLPVVMGIYITRKFSERETHDTVQSTGAY
jgi:hypothetical protein